MKFSLVFFILLSMNPLKFKADDLKFDEEALSKREEMRSIDEYTVEESLIDEYDVSDIFSEEESSLEGIYTTEDLFKSDDIKEVSLVDGEFDDIYIEDVTYHDTYASDDKTSFTYYIIIIIFLIAISYMLTNIYLTIKYRREYAKNKTGK